MLSSFGCGPDAFTALHLEDLLRDRPRLFLEFDEHRGEAGLVTRLEAFLDEVETYRRAHRDPIPRVPSPAPPRSRIRGAVYIPYFADHAHAFSVAFRAAGYRAEVLPPPTKEAEQAGCELCSGKECYPYVMMAGDLATLARSGKVEQGDIFFFPGTTYFPCLLSQFRSGYRYLLKALGMDGLEVLTLHSKELLRVVGIPAAVHLWQGLMAIDFLVKMVCAIRPYEVRRGETDRAHRTNLAELEQAIAAGHPVEAFERCAQRLRDIPIRGDADKPLVGVAGDVYTRINAFSNDNLFARLEQMGCEVWPAPFLVDAFDFGTRRYMRRAVMERSFITALTEGALLFFTERTQRKLRSRLGGGFARLDEPRFDEVLRLAAPYMEAEANSIVLLNVAKMAHFAQNGADGVVHAMGLNCAVGTISAALLGRIRADHDYIPMVNLVYGETGGTNQRARLEAFVHQVRRRAARTRNTGKKGEVLAVRV
jgi:predicted nucleotide-binding protein (sugar kinase/HSP70/actin superfamily)